MKRWLIASLVGGLLLFIWQFFSWTVSGIHDEAGKYHPQQDQIMQTLSTHINEDGTYMLPTSPPGTSMEEQEKQMEAMEGKPMAMITYVTRFRTDMYRPMIRGFLIDVSLIFLLVYILTRAGTPSFGGILGASLAVGFTTWLWGPYTAHNWFQMPWGSILGHLIDGMVGYGLVGLWLGWYLNRGTKK